ncbi:MAG: hypothetical protein ACRDOO_17350 [Actinomadura sp.]
MSAGWVAGSVRARALARRRLGPGRTRMLAASPSLGQALMTLTGTPYGRHVDPHQRPAEAQRAVAAVFLWHLRVLAGWLPREGVETARTAAGWFELANVDELLQRTGPREGVFQLGELATAWPSLERSTTPAQLRAALAATRWGDPGETDIRAIRLGMRMSLAQRIAGRAPQCAAWSAGVVAVCVASERFGARQVLPGMARRRAARLIGAAAVDALTLPEMISQLSARARWALDGVEDPADLWRAEARCWARLERDGLGMLSEPGFTSGPVVGAIAVLATDAWRVRAALESAARGGGPVEAYDAVA